VLTTVTPPEEAPLEQPRGAQILAFNRRHAIIHKRRHSGLIRSLEIEGENDKDEGGGMVIKD
jgi:hypothetical protein